MLLLYASGYLMCIFDEKLSEETLATLQNFEFAVRSNFNILYPILSIWWQKFMLSFQKMVSRKSFSIIPQGQESLITFLVISTIKSLVCFGKLMSSWYSKIATLHVFFVQRHGESYYWRPGVSHPPVFTSYDEGS